jgi:hypothetical protein
MKMKKFILIAVAATVLAAVVCADDRPVTFEQLPKAAKEFVNANFPGVKTLYITKDDDFAFPEYEVALENGVRIQFEHNGSLEQIETRNAPLPAGIVPSQILDYVRLHYPDAFCVGYEKSRNSHEVKLSNRLELKFSSNYHLIEIDD